MQKDFEPNHLSNKMRRRHFTALTSSLLALGGTLKLTKPDSAIAAEIDYSHSGLLQERIVEVNLAQQMDVV